MKVFLKKYFGLVFIVIFVFLYFSYLFFPHLKIFATPDFGQSDIVDLHIPLKFLLAKALAANTLPFWTQSLGDGFPLLASIEIGALNPVNLILFKLFPFVIAFNLIYVTVFIINAIGVYFFTQKLKLSKIVSIITAIIYSFSGYFMAQIPHTDILQTVIYLPWYFWATYKLYDDKNKLIPVILLGLIIALSCISVYPQIVFISLIGSFLFLMFLIKNNLRQHFYSKIILYSISVTLGFLIALPQLLPAIEFLGNSIRSQGLNLDLASYFAYPPQHLFTLLNPFFLGNPTIGTYPLFNQFGGSIFWENTAYIGLIPLIFSVFSIKIIKKSKFISFFLMLTLLSFVLMLGHFSPFKFIYALPFFSLFRVPSRFILLFVFSLSILFAFSLENFKEFLERRFSKNIITIFLAVIFIASFLDIQWYFYNYNSLLSPDKLFQTPPVAKLISPSTARVFDLLDENAWNQVFLKNWGKNINTIPYFNNYLRRNVNVLYGVNQAQVYMGNSLQANANFDSLIYSGMQIDENNQVLLSTASAKLLLMENVGYILSPYKIYSPYVKSYQIKANNNLPDLYLTTLPTSERAYIVHEKLVVTISQIYQTLLDPGFNPWKMVLLENEDGNLTEQNNTNDKVVNKELSDNKLVFETYTGSPGYLIIADTFYPGWKATVNGDETQILNANSFQKAIYIPKGKSTVVVYYYPQSFITGFIVSLLSILTIIVITVFSKKKLLGLKFENNP